jgi:DNA-binding transcriptional ArsR family regulator
VQITDPTAIRALAHPLRLDLMELLAAVGPATAAHCGRTLGTSQANCSFHLRQLAKYGFVEDAGPGPDRRERRWRIPEPRPTLHIAAGRSGVQRELERLVIEREARAMVDHLDREPEPGWQDMPGPVTAVAVVSLTEAVQLRQKWKDLLEPYLARTASRTRRSDQRHVRYFMAATPLPPLDPEDPHE